MYFFFLLGADGQRLGAVGVFGFVLLRLLNLCVKCNSLLVIHLYRKLNETSSSLSFFLFSWVVGWLLFFCEHMTTHDLELVLAT